MSFIIIPKDYYNKRQRINPDHKLELNDDNVHDFMQDYHEIKATGIILNIKNLGLLESYAFENIKYLQVKKKLDLVVLEKVFPNIECLRIDEIKKEFLLNDINKFLKLEVLILYRCNFQVSENIQRLIKLAITHKSLLEGQFKYFSNISELSLISTQNIELSGLEYLVNLNFLDYGWPKNDAMHLDKLKDLVKIQGMTFFRASRLKCLPSLKKCINLKAICLEECHQLENLKGIYDAPNLDALYIMDCRSLKPDAFYPFKGHPTLRHIYWGAFPREQESVIKHLGDIWDPEMVNMHYVLDDLL